MAVYGTNVKTGVARNGLIPFTGWTGVLAEGGPAGAVNQGPTGNVSFNGQTSNDNKIAQVFRKSGALNKTLRQMLSNLIGSAAGVGTGTQNSYKQVKGVGGNNNLGGLVQIEDGGITNRVTTVADRDALKQMIFRSVFPTTSAVGSVTQNYIEDRSGNGGGGKVRY